MPLAALAVGLTTLDAVGLEREAVAVEHEALHVHLGEAGCGDARLARQRREVESVLLGDVHRPLVRVGVDHPHEARVVAEDVVEGRVVRRERHPGCGNRAHGAHLASPPRRGPCRSRTPR